MNLLLLAAAPVFLLAFYLYYRDKYEKEPLGMLIKALIAGAFIVLPILFVEIFISKYVDKYSGSTGAFLDAFAVAGFTEEIFKWLAVYLLFFRSKQFNERFDGIVYAGIVSLGFALVENIMYVVGNDSASVGYMRAITAVPGHMLFGVVMGYSFGLAKFLPANRGWHLLMAFFMPFLLHGIYDYLLMEGKTWSIILFFPFVGFMWYFGLVRMKRHSLNSAFNNAKFGEPTNGSPQQ